MFKFLIDFIRGLFYKKQCVKPKVLWESKYQTKQKIFFGKRSKQRFFELINIRESYKRRRLTKNEIINIAKETSHYVCPTKNDLNYNSHKKYYNGTKGHNKRQRIRKAILNYMGINYEMR